MDTSIGNDEKRLDCHRNRHLAECGGAATGTWGDQAVENSNGHTNPHSLILGGARSGKTRRALALAELRRWRIYIATAEPLDDEMRSRIQRHRAERGAGWTTAESPLALATTLARLSSDIRATGRAEETAIVVDCLTLWLANLMHAEQNIERETEEFVEALSSCPAPVIIVSNEVGHGIVPENKLARDFRDAQGRLNQTVAAAAGSVEIVIAGLSMRLK